MNSESAPQSQLKQLLILAWPVIVSRSTQVIDGLADALMVAHLGEAALASTTTGALNSYALFIFPMGIAFVIASFSSQLTGRKDPVGARRYGWYGLGLAAGSQLVMFALLPFLTPIMQWFDYDADVEKAMTLYLSIRLLSTGASVGIEALGNYYGGTGNTAILMRINLLAMVLNIFFNWLLIDGHLGFPAMGVAGAAWSSVLSTGIAFAIFLTKFLWDGRQFGRLGLTWREFGRLLKFGAPSGFNFSFEFFAFLAFINVVVGGLGTVSLAAMMAVIQLNSFAFMPAIGIGSAGAILVGQAIGRGEKHLVPGLLKLTFLVTAVWMCLVGAAYIVLPGPLLVHFTPAGESGARFMDVGVRMLILSAFWQLFDAAGITISETLRAAGDTAFTMWVRGFLAWLVFLPGSWISVRYFGGNEMTALVWLLIYLGLLAVALFLRFRSGAWKKIELVEEAAVV